MEQKNNPVPENSPVSQPSPAPTEERFSAAAKAPSSTESATQRPWYSLPQEEAEKERLLPKPEYAALDAVFAWLMLALSFFFVRFFPVGTYPLGGLLGVWALLLLEGLYLHLSGHRLRLRGILLASLAAILSIGLILSGNVASRNLLFLLLLAAMAALAYDACGLAGRKLSSDGLLSHLANATLRFPFCALTALFPSLSLPLRRSHASRKLWKTVGWVLLGLCIAVIPTVIVAALLSYDAQFTALLERLLSFSLDGFFETVGDLILAVPLAMLLFGTLFAVKARAKKTGSAEERPFSVGRFRVMPPALLCAAVTPILLLYVLFFVSQWSYYVSAFTHVLPSGMTYAQYAREGFFQLFTVSIINALLLLALHLLMRTPPSGKPILRRIYSAVLALLTLVLIATALSKMILYIHSYGLTQKRVYASAVMLFLAVCFLSVLLRQLIRRFPSVPVTLVAGLLLAAAMTLGNPDALIASYNVDAYLRGDLETVDVEALADLGDSAIPAMVKLEWVWKEENLLGRLSHDEREALRLLSDLLDARAEKVLADTPSPLSFSIPAYRARALLSQRSASGE
ncbi:MAG: DUF4173 domain-containing protein [Clostridia bacterium]|nr:DUF4173 domain-containing protein [Clostridia bacterium]